MSTRKLALLATVAAVLVAVLVAASINLGRGHSTSSPSPQPPSTPPTSTEATYNPDASDADATAPEEEGGPPEAQEEVWGPAVDNFAKNFTRVDGGAKKWRQRLIGHAKHPYVTPKVAEELATVDIRKVPTGHYESREIVESGPFNLAVGVYYDEGWAMLLWLNTDGTNWQIYAYDKWDQ